MNKGMLVVLSAPAGCGKDTVFKELCKIRNDVVESVSATTRQAREGEVDGVNYFFMSVDEFEGLIESNGLIEYVKYNDNYYGTPVEGIKKAIDGGKICFLIIEVNGGRRVKEIFPDALTIFLLPPSLEVLEKRLRGRGTDTEEAIISRLNIANNELSYKDTYDYQVVNDELDACVSNINKILSDELAKRIAD